MMRLWAAWAMACVVLECSRRVRKNGGFYNPSRAPNALANASRGPPLLLSSGLEWQPSQENLCS